MLQTIVTMSKGKQCNVISKCCPCGAKILSDRPIMLQNIFNLIAFSWASKSAQLHFLRVSVRESFVLINCEWLSYVRLASRLIEFDECISSNLMSAAQRLINQRLLVFTHSTTYFANVKVLCNIFPHLNWRAISLLMSYSTKNIFFYLMKRFSK